MPKKKIKQRSKTTKKKIKRPSSRPLHLLFGVTGCVQAEVVPRVALRFLKEPKVQPLEIIAVATQPALNFFNRKLLEKVTRHPVYVSHTDYTSEFSVPHIHLAEWADLIVIYPASANTLAKCAHGICDSLISTIVLSSRSPVFFGPTMNDLMYKNSITQRNIHTLKKAGHRFIPREKAPVFVHSLNKVVEKPYCTERSVVRTTIGALKKIRSGVKGS